MSHPLPALFRPLRARERPSRRLCSDRRRNRPGDHARAGRRQSQSFPWAALLTANPNGRLPTNRFIGEPGDHDVIGNCTFTQLDEKTENVSRHQASVWGKSRFAIAGRRGFSAGAGVRYMGAFADGGAPTVPSSTLLDAMAAWDTGPWRLALNVNNATDRVCVSTCLRRGDRWWGARRNVVASVSYRY